jgi:hypothetical protein
MAEVGWIFLKALLLAWPHFEAFTVALTQVCLDKKHNGQKLQMKNASRAFFHRHLPRISTCHTRICGRSLHSYRRYRSEVREDVVGPWREGVTEGCLLLM